MTSMQPAAAAAAACAGMKKEMVLVVRCNADERPVRLPGRPSMPVVYGSSGGGRSSPPGLGQFKPPNLFGKCISSGYKIRLFHFSPVFVRIQPVFPYFSK